MGNMRPVILALLYGLAGLVFDPDDLVCRQPRGRHRSHYRRRCRCTGSAGDVHSARDGAADFVNCEMGFWIVHRGDDDCRVLHAEGQNLGRLVLEDD